MNPMPIAPPSLCRQRALAMLLSMLLACVTGPAKAAKTDLATAPLETSTATLVKPNILFILDDSGSMDRTYLPDWATSSDLSNYLTVSSGCSGKNASSTCETATTKAAKLMANSRINGLYYDPAITYTPPKAYNGSSYTAMSSANTSAWTAVPDDGFKVQATGSTNLAGKTLTFYTFVPGEFCTAPNLRTCATQTAASSTYPYPAYLRWCTTATLTSCQASRIETAPANGSAYLYPRYPGALTSTQTTVPGSVVATTLSAGTSSYAYPGSTRRASTRTDCVSTTTTCSYDEEMSNVANWWAYYQTRMQMMKSAMSLALSDLGDSYRMGYMSINNNTGSDFLDMAELGTASGGQKAKLYAKLFAAKPNSSTPLRTALSTAGRYVAGQLSTVNGVSAGDPMQYACQRNYTLLSTDGYWNENATPVQVNGSTPIGDQDGSESRPYLDGNATANTLADVAAYYYKTDLRSASFGNTINRSTGTDVSSNSFSNGQQRMITYTVGLGASGYMLYDSGYASATSGDYHDVLMGTTTSASTLANGTCIWQSTGACNWPVPASNTQTAIDDLWHAAINGRGTYYSAANVSDLRSGLDDFVTSVNAETSNSATATVSTPNLSASSSNHIWASSFCSAKWFGELARYSIDAATGALASTPDWSESGAGSDCVDASSTLVTTPLLDKLTWSNRKLYTYNASASPTLINFAWDSLSASMQAHFKVAALGSLTQMCASGSTCLPSTAQVDSSTAGTTTGAGGVNLVNFLRGDRSNEGSSNTKYYLARTHVLGDIVNSQAVYVQQPTFRYADDGYSTFKAAQATRTGMVYVGANDGMLHAFNADTGAEAWAYIPSMLLPKLYQLADKKYASRHVNLVDGPLTRADAFFDGSWHTILVGGLGEGGRGYFALDITNPASPAVLWEFTSDTSANAAYTRDEDLGNSDGQPVVTKLSDGTWVVALSSGYNNVSPGSGHGIVWLLDAATGKVLHKLDTGAGSSSAAVAGCSTAPCPSGLARLSAWVQGSSDNTAARLYGGDLLGNVWRFDLGALTATGGSASIQLLATLADPDGVRQPVSTTPELGYANGRVVVYVGTGRYLGVSDVSSTQTQSIYALRDPLTGNSTTSALYNNPRTSACSASVKTNCFVQQVATDTSGVRTVSSSVSEAVDLSTMSGWFMDLPQVGERINTDPALTQGTLVYVSNVPTTSSACTTGGSSYINYVDYQTGLAVSNATEAGKLLSSTALASAAALVNTTSSGTKGVVTLSDGKRTTIGIPTSSASTGTRRLSWRELIIGQ
jgi:type IV pilus assembly protein PilY1